MSRKLALHTDILRLNIADNIAVPVHFAVLDLQSFQVGTSNSYRLPLVCHIGFRLDLFKASISIGTVESFALCLLERKLVWTYISGKSALGVVNQRRSYK